MGVSVKVLTPPTWMSDSFSSSSPSSSSMRESLCLSSSIFSCRASCRSRRVPITMVGGDTLPQGQGQRLAEVTRSSDGRSVLSIYPFECSLFYFILEGKDTGDRVTVYYMSSSYLAVESVLKFKECNKCFAHESKPLKLKNR